jgi:cytochrome c553
MRKAFRMAAPLIAVGLQLGPHAVAAADQELGAFLAGTCSACHQPGSESAAFPAITGRDEATFIAAMQAFRSGERPDSIMQAVATSLSDEETAALAHYLATQGKSP